MSNIDMFINAYQRALDQTNTSSNPEKWLATIAAFARRDHSLGRVSIDSASFKLCAKMLGIANTKFAWEKYLTDGGKSLPAIRPKISDATHKRVANALVNTLMQTVAGGPEAYAKSQMVYAIDRDFIASAFSATEFFKHLNKTFPVQYELAGGKLIVKLERKLSLQELMKAFAPA